MAKLTWGPSRVRLYDEKQKLILDFCRRYPEDVYVDSARILPKGILELGLTGNALGRIHTLMSVDEFKTLFPGGGRLLKNCLAWKRWSS